MLNSYYTQHELTLHSALIRDSTQDFVRLHRLPTRNYLVTLVSNSKKQLAGVKGIVTALSIELHQPTLAVKV